MIRGDRSYSDYSLFAQRLPIFLTHHREHSGHREEGEREKYFRPFFVRAAHGV